jgi:hypothetical protein
MNLRVKDFSVPISIVVVHMISCRERWDNEVDEWGGWVGELVGLGGGENVKRLLYF